MNKRLCDTCGNVIEENGCFSPIEVRLHYEKCHMGDGKDSPIVDVNYEFDTIECLEKKLPEIKKEVEEMWQNYFKSGRGVTFF